MFSSLIENNFGKTIKINTNIKENFKISNYRETTEYHNDVNYIENKQTFEKNIKRLIDTILKKYAICNVDINNTEFIPNGQYVCDSIDKHEHKYFYPKNIQYREDKIVEIINNDNNKILFVCKFNELHLETSNNTLILKLFFRENSWLDKYTEYQDNIFTTNNIDITFEKN